MKSAQKRSRRDGQESSGHRNELEIQVVEKSKEKARFDRLLSEKHYIGKAKPTGDFLRQVAVVDGQWVGLLAWGAGCYALKDRDQWIGWSRTQRAERQKLIVQNRRFLLLGERGEHPNLASQILGAATRSLPEQWEERFGYRPLLAETFTDIEQFAGTCYKAAGWEPVGMSKGYGRHRADFFVHHERPKKLWLKALSEEARERLCGAQVPAAQQPGAHSNAHGVLPFEQPQCRSLMETLQQMDDPRASNTQFRIGSVLSIVAMALLSGCRDLSAIHRFGQRLTQKQRALIGLPRKRGSRFYKIPCYSVYYRLLAALDLDRFAELLSDWLSAQSGSLPAALAMDGKMIRDVIGLVSLVDQETGVPVAMGPMSQKEGEGQRCEMKVAEKLVGQGPPLDGKVLTADALHTQKATAAAVVEQGGDYLFQIKGNRQKLHDYAQKASGGATPLLSKPSQATAGSSDARSP
jgi:hypothetical protein